MSLNVTNHFHPPDKTYLVQTGSHHPTSLVMALHNKDSVVLKLKALVVAYQEIYKVFGSL